MSRQEKLWQRFLSRPKDFSWQELKALLSSLGYVQSAAGKTGGSRVKFLHDRYPAIFLHRPHPSPYLKSYQVEQIIEILKESMP